MKMNKKNSSKKKNTAHGGELKSESAWQCIKCGCPEHLTPVKRLGTDGIRNICNACYIKNRAHKERTMKGSARPSGISQGYRFQNGYGMYGQTGAYTISPTGMSSFRNGPYQFYPVGFPLEQYQQQQLQAMAQQTPVYEGLQYYQAPQFLANGNEAMGPVKGLLSPESDTKYNILPSPSTYPMMINQISPEAKRFKLSSDKASEDQQKQSQKDTFVTAAPAEEPHGGTTKRGTRSNKKQGQLV